MGIGAHHNLTLQRRSSTHLEGNREGTDTVSEVDVQHPTQSTNENTSRAPAHLLPWKKGQSGNPGGRPKLSPELRQLLLDKSGRAIERLVELMESQDERIAFMASKEILDRTYGRPKDADTDDDDKRSVTINIVKLAPDGNNTATQLAPTTVSVRSLALS